MADINVNRVDERSDIISLFNLVFGKKSKLPYPKFLETEIVEILVDEQVCWVGKTIFSAKQKRHRKHNGVFEDIAAKMIFSEDLSELIIEPGTSFRLLSGERFMVLEYEVVRDFCGDFYYLSVLLAKEAD